jgi:hypothetical protein
MPQSYGGDRFEIPSPPSSEGRVREGWSRSATANPHPSVVSPPCGRRDDDGLPPIRLRHYRCSCFFSCILSDMYDNISFMESHRSYADVKRQIRRKLKTLGDVDIFVAGSLGQIHRKCGNPNCRCAREGEGHPAYLLTSKVKGKSKAIYVPMDMVEEVQEWSREYRRVKKRLEEISAHSEELIRLHSKQKRATCSSRKRK